MTAETLIQQLENYYGEYQNQKLKSFVLAYVKKDHEQSKLEQLLRSILYYHRANFNAPCIASIEECIKQARIEKGQVDTHKGKKTNTERYNFSESKDPEYEKVNVDLKAMLNKAVKKVGK